MKYHPKEQNVYLQIIHDQNETIITLSKLFAQLAAKASNDLTP